MDLLEKIRKIEALIERGATEGERQAAVLARQRIEERKQTEEIEYTISTSDRWHKKLFNAVCYKYNLKPYRYHRQKYTTVMVKVSRQFMNEVIWPEYSRFSDVLEELVNEVTTGVITKIHTDESEVVIAGEIEGKQE